MQNRESTFLLSQRQYINFPFDMDYCMKFLYMIIFDTHSTMIFNTSQNNEIEVSCNRK